MPRKASDRAGIAVHPAGARHRSQAQPGAYSAPREEHDLHPESGSTGKKTSRRPLCGTQNDFRGADDKFSGQPICASYGRKKGGQRKTAARPFGIKRKSEVPIPRINPNRTNAREPGEDDRRARGLNSREHGPGHGKDQCFTLPSASGLCLYLKTSAKTTPTTRA